LFFSGAKYFVVLYQLQQLYLYIIPKINEYLDSEVFHDEYVGILAEIPTAGRRFRSGVLNISLNLFIVSKNKNYFEV